MTLELTPSAWHSLLVVPTRATSETARYLAGESDQRRRRLRFSYSLGLGMADEEVSRIAEECARPNWDGYGAAPIAVDTRVQACFFLAALPLGTSAPSIGAEPDGHLTLEWYRSPRHTLSVSVSPEGDLHYAALLGPARAYGTEPFLGEVPQTILDLIRRVAPEKSRSVELIAA